MSLIVMLHGVTDNDVTWCHWQWCHMYMYMYLCNITPCVLTCFLTWLDADTCGTVAMGYYMIEVLITDKQLYNPLSPLQASPISPSGPPLCLPSVKFCIKSHSFWEYRQYASYCRHVHVSMTSLYISQTLRRGKATRHKTHPKAVIFNENWAEACCYKAVIMIPKKFIWLCKIYSLLELHHTLFMEKKWYLHM